MEYKKVTYGFKNFDSRSMKQGIILGLVLINYYNQ